MASTYSTNLSLELPGTGDQSGTWGTTANRDMGTLLEQAISGFVEQQFNTDADITLTILSGADGGGNVTPGIIYGTSTPGTAASPVSARNMYIKCTGTLTAARTLTVPTNRKLYYIYNNTTGGFALTVKTAAGTGISVPNGSKMLLVCDGTNIVESINYFSSLTFNSLTVTGNVTLSGGTANGVAYLNGSKVVTTGTGLTYDGSLLYASNNFKVGGGAASNTSKLMVNTASGTAAGIQLYQDANESWVIQNPASSTGLAFANSGSEKMRLTATGNLGIGTTSPAYKLDVNDASSAIIQTRTTSSGNAGLIASTAAGGVAYLQLTSAAGDNFIYGGSGGTQNLSFSVGGSERMRITATGDVGIGTSSPLSKLDVTSGYITAGTVASSNGSKILAGNYSAGAITTFGSEYSNGGPVIGYGVWPSTSAPDAFISSSSFPLYRGAYVSAGGIHKFYGGTVQTVAIGSPVSISETMRLTLEGNLGIGTASPTARLDVRGPSGIGIQIYETSTGNNSRLIITQSDTVSTYNSTFTSTSTSQAWQIGGTEFMRLNSSGSLLINSTASSFAEKLSVLGTGATTTPTNLSSLAGSLILVKSAQALTSYGGVGYNDSGGGGAAVVFGRGLSYDTNIGFYTNPSSTATPGAMTQRMVIDSSGSLLVGTTTASAKFTLEGATLSVGFRSTVASGEINCQLIQNSTSGTAIQFYTSGTTAAGTITTSGTSTAYNTSSDYRLKNISGPVQNSGAYIDSLKPVEGTWKADGSTFVGLIAHEVQEVSRTTIATGVKDGLEMQAMDYSNSELIANLIAEIQSLRTRVAQLEGR